MESLKVVIRYAAGDLIKGFTQDFFPNKERFHVFPVDQSHSRAVEVSIRDLKAVFVVRDYVGDDQYNEKKEFTEGDTRTGKKVAVSFTDGEVMVGSTLAMTGIDPDSLFFRQIPTVTTSGYLQSLLP